MSELPLPPAPVKPAPAATLSTEIRLRVRSADGKVRVLAVSARSESEAVRKAAARGLQVLSVEGVGVAAAPAGVSARRGRFPLMLFSQELLALLESGLHLTEALGALLAKERQGVTRDVLRALLGALQEGRSFSDVLESRKELFPEVYVATVRAAERTGDLPDALARYVAYQVQFETVRKKLIAAAIYPTLLLVVGLCVSIFLLGYVVPRFSVMYESTGKEMPWMSERLLDFGRFIHANAAASAAVLGAVLAAMATVLVQPRGRAALLDLAVRLPGFATQAAQFRIARFFRAISLLLSSGIALPRALAMVDGLLGASQRRALIELRRLVDEGQSLSAALVAAGLSDPISDSLIKVGERSGQLALMLERTARFYDEAFGRWLDWLSRLLEPLLMIFIGGVIGSIVVLMYMPIFELAGTIQ